MKEQKLNKICTVCSKSNLITKLSLNDQPPANRFIALNNINSNEEKSELALGYCLNCYTPQLTQKLPRESIRPVYDWLKYNEPETHLDNVVAQIVPLSNLKKNDRIIGLSYKDQSTLNRLDIMGFSNSICLTNEEFDIFASNPFQSLEKLKTPAKLIFARHVIEHADSATNLILQLKEFLDKDGYLILEIPTNEKVFKNFHYPFIWEEHVSYFNKESVQLLAKAAKAAVLWSKCYEYEYEDSLVFALSFNSQISNNNSLHDKHHQSTLVLLEEFCRSFSDIKTQWQNYLQELKSKNNSVALFGAGHLSAKFINFFELEKYIDCVIDDHPNKVGLLMPGSKLPIKPSSELVNQKITHCFSTLSPESEQKVKVKLQPYLETGGHFISVFNTLIAHV